MELYRVLTRPSTEFTCKADAFLRELYRRAKPQLPEGDDNFDIEKLAKAEATMFFPASEVRAFVTRDMLQTITTCDCASCESFRPTNGLSGGQRNNLIDIILDDNHKENTSAIVASLVYLKEARRLYQLSTLTSGLVGGINGLLADKGFLDKYPAFARNLSWNKPIFDPPKFLLGDTENHFNPGTRFPFLDEEYFDKGSFGVVTRFEIHPDYIDPKVSEVVTEYITKPRQTLPAGTKLYFARKTYQGVRNQTSKADVDLEREVFHVIARQKSRDKKNLMDMIAFYTFGDEINLVFPFVPGSLEKVLYEDWKPEHADTEEFPLDWITTGLLGLAKGLRVLHNPPTQPTEGCTILGFHFDLKPENILITSTGVFKITDFGQSLIKVVQIGESLLEGIPHDAGDPCYAPPEGMPTREQVKRSSQSYKYPVGVDVRSRRPHITVNPSVDHLVQRSNSRLRVHASQRGSRNSTQSYMSSQQAMGSAEYDIWSLACIILETLTYTQLGHRKAVQMFRTKLREDVDEPGFHDGHSLLKICVHDQLSFFTDGEKGKRLWSKSMQSYLNEMVTLMKKMFQIEIKKRPGASEVEKDLKQAIDNYQNSKDDPDGLLAEIRQYRFSGQSNFDEVFYGDRDTSFMYAKDVHVCNPSAGPGFNECRIRVFTTKKWNDEKAGVMILVATLQDNKAGIEEYLCKLEKCHFTPLYLFTGEKLSWKHSCKIRVGDSSRIFQFTSNPKELLVFQAAFFRHTIVPHPEALHGTSTDIDDSRFIHSITPPIMVVLNFKHERGNFEAIPHAMQIWTEKQSDDLSTNNSRQTQSTTSSGPSPARMSLLLFLHNCTGVGTRKRYGVLQIPIEPGLTTIKEGDLHQGTRETTSLTFLPRVEGSSSSFFRSMLWEVDAGKDRATSLHLYPLFYRFETFPADLQKAHKIKILFSNHSDIETIREHFDAANIGNNPKIMWRSPKSVIANR